MDNSQRIAGKGTVGEHINQIKFHDYGYSADQNSRQPGCQSGNQLAPTRMTFLQKVFTSGALSAN